MVKQLHHKLLHTTPATTCPLQTPTGTAGEEEGRGGGGGGVAYLSSCSGESIESVFISTLTGEDQTGSGLVGVPK